METDINLTSGLLQANFYSYINKRGYLMIVAQTFKLKETLVFVFTQGERSL